MSIKPSIIAAVAVLSGCAHNPVPDEHILPLEELGRTPHGLWVVVDRGDAGPPLEGELIAADERELVVGDPEAVHVPLGIVVRATVCAYPSDASDAIWGGVGVLTTVSHGVFLIVSAPIWLTTATIVGVAEHNTPIISYPDRPVTALAKYARFPPGLPAGY